MRAQSGETRQEAAELRESIAAYAATLQNLGEPSGRVIEEVRLIADQAARAVMRGGPVERPHRAALTQDLVLWAVDAFIDRSVN